MFAQKNYDVIVIGGGPAGATTAALLAEKGRKVLVLEKEKFPRYHVGESLMPFCWYTLERLGVLEEMKRFAFVEKQSVQFVTQDGTQSAPFYFFQHRDHPSSITWQVERSEFDLMLLNNARARGAEVHEQTKVTRVLKSDSGAVIGVEAIGPDGERREVFAPMTVDCSGREAITTAREGWRVKDSQLNKLALWTYYRGAKRDPGIDEGSTTVAYVAERGWFWYIPLKGDIVSVGVVAEKDYLFGEDERPRRGLPARDRAQCLDRGSPQRRHAIRRVLRHERVLVSLALLRGRWIAPRRRRVRVSRSRLFQRRLPRAEERRAGRRRDRRGAGGGRRERGPLRRVRRATLRGDRKHAPARLRILRHEFLLRPHAQALSGNCAAA